MIVSKKTPERQLPVFAPIALLLVKDMGEQNELSSLSVKSSGSRPSRRLTGGILDEFFAITDTAKRFPEDQIHKACPAENRKDKLLPRSVPTRSDAKLTPNRIDTQEPLPSQHSSLISP